MSGPRVLNSARTSVVAAGAVAEQIAPKINPRETACVMSFVISQTTSVTIPPTTIAGVIA